MANPSPEDRQKILDIIKTDPGMSYLTFKKVCDIKISDTWFYQLRINYREANDIKPYRLLHNPRPAQPKEEKAPKRKYTRRVPLVTGKRKYTRRTENVGRRPYNRTMTYLVLWSQNSDNMDKGTLNAIKTIVHSLKKTKRMNLELVQTLDPGRVELREYSN